MTVGATRKAGEKTGEMVHGLTEIASGQGRRVCGHQIPPSSEPANPVHGPPPLRGLAPTRRGCQEGVLAVLLGRPPVRELLPRPHRGALKRRIRMLIVAALALLRGLKRVLIRGLPRGVLGSAAMGGSFGWSGARGRRPAALAHAITAQVQGFNRSLSDAFTPLDRDATAVAQQPRPIAFCSGCWACRAALA